jgi:hypothetical protein
VLVTWWDASQSSTETLTGPVSALYNAGVLDEVVGFLVEENEKWIILADSFEADAAVDESARRFRSVRNIPRSLVCQITRLDRKGVHLVEASATGQKSSRESRSVREAQAGKGKGGKVASGLPKIAVAKTSRGLMRPDKLAASSVRKRGTMVVLAR